MRKAIWAAMMITWFCAGILLLPQGHSFGDRLILLGWFVIAIALLFIAPTRKTSDDS